jgi:hypothetical protein
MSICSFLLACILAAGPAPPSEAPGAHLTSVFATDFGDPSDSDFNGWPDGWTRRHGGGFPRFVEVALDFESLTPEIRGSLRARMNGGAVEISSPAIPIDERHNYALSAAIKTAGLTHSQASARLTLLDENGKEIESFASATVGGTADWTTVDIPPSNAGGAAARFAVVRLVVNSDGRHDLAGDVWFHHVRLYEQPRLRIEANHPLALYSEPGTIELQIGVAGLKREMTDLQLELLDFANQVLAHSEMKLDLNTSPAAATSVAAGAESAEPDAGVEWSGVVSWRPPVKDFGYYRVRARLGGEGDELAETISLCVLDPQTRWGGQFGWSFSAEERDKLPPAIIELIQQAGIGWVKMPLWLDEKDPRAAPTRQLLATLNLRNINCVGVLATPPASVRAKLPSSAFAANVFTADPKIWYPSLENVFLQFGIETRYWQLGRDGDRSFVGFPELNRRLIEIKKQLETSGQALHMGIGWDWIEELPADQGTLRFVDLSSHPALTTQETQNYLQETARGQTSRWLNIEPAWLATLASQDRAAALVQRMVTAAAFGADGIFFAAPLDRAAGLIEADGRPTELYVAWRSTAQALAGATQIGSTPLPEGSHNRVFVRGDKAVMVVWRDEPASETLYLGEQVVCRDMFGTEVPLERDGDQVVLPVGRAPRFVHGVSPDIARWRIATTIEPAQLPSTPGQTFTARLSLNNTFGQNVSGRVRLATPQGWIVHPSQFDFRLSSGERLARDLRVTLPFGVESGAQQVRAEFELFADRPYRLDSFVPVVVGLGDVEIVVNTQVNTDGVLEIEQRLSNHTDQPIRFSCSLFARERRRQRFELVGPPQGQTYATFRVPNGSALVGETLWLRATEIGGRRVLNYRFVVEP